MKGDDYLDSNQRKVLKILAVIIPITVIVIVSIPFLWKMTLKEERLPPQERWQLVNVNYVENGDGTTHTTLKYIGENNAYNVYVDTYSDIGGLFRQEFNRWLGEEFHKGETVTIDVRGYTLTVFVDWKTVDVEWVSAKIDVLQPR